MRLNDALTGVVLFIFAIAVIAYSTTFPTLHGQDFGPSLFPILIGSCLLVCALLLIARGLQRHRQPMRPINTTDSNAAGTPNDRVWIQWGEWASTRSRQVNMLLVPGLLIAYIMLSDWIGFIPLSMLILIVLLYRLGSTLLTSVLTAAGTTTLLQLLFAKVLLVPLPSGLLLRWLA